MNYLLALRFFGYFAIGFAIVALAQHGLWFHAIVLGLGGFALSTVIGSMLAKREETPK